MQVLKDIFEAIEAVAGSLQNMTKDTWSFQSTVFNLHTTVKHMESRMERFLQEGCETVRHIAGIVEEYDMERASGGTRWAFRRLIEEQSAWSSARSRFGELGSLEAFNLVVEAAVRRVKADIEDMRWRASQEWIEEAEKKVHRDEASRLEKNLGHLKQHVQLFRGAPEVADVQLEMKSLIKQFIERKPQILAGACCEDFFTTATAFLSRDLPAYEGAEQ